MLNPIFKLILKGKAAAKGAATKGAKNMFFNTLIDVIRTNEGGYFHPDMFKDGRLKPSERNLSLYRSSGETMYGIDRKAGGAINDTTAGRRFWAVIDKANARKSWKWNFNGGDLAPVLLPLAADVMKPQAEKYFSTYLSPEARTIVEKDNRLLYHFIYAVWNGPGWFQSFAKLINKAVAEGVKDRDKLWSIAIDSRINPLKARPNTAPYAVDLIRQGGLKIEKLFKA
jgi:hypothetical protein